jgi:putative ABC transport system permease protein
MLSNYLKTGWRSLTRGRLYSLINLTGLSIGTAVVILLSLYIREELTYENFHSDPDRIYRVWVKEHVEGEVFFNTVTPFILGPQLQGHLPEIEAMARYANLSSPVRLAENTSSATIYLVDPDFLKIFHFPLISGNEQALNNNPLGMILSRQTAEKYFGKNNPIGETLEVQLEGEWISFVIEGVSQDPPSNTGLQFDILIPMGNAERLYSPQAQTSWTNVFVETFIKLNAENDLAGLEKKVIPFIDNQVKDVYEPGQYIVGFQPLGDIHLNNEFPVGILPVSDGRYPAIMAAIAFLILLLAAINFTTLAVGRSLKRAKEVGIRKTSGASRWQLMQQFWSEAIVTAAISVVFGLGLAYILMPSFNRLADKSMTLYLDGASTFFVFFLIFFIGILSGLYPSLILSKVDPITSLRGSSHTSGQMPKHLILRSLVGFQFILSVFLICCTLIMKKQINFLQNTNLGFAKDQTVILPYTKPGTRLSEVIEEATQKVKLMKDQLMTSGRIQQIAMSNHTFGSSGWTNLGYVDQNSQKYEWIRANGIDASFIPMHQIQLLEGRNFETDNLADRKSVIINKTYSQQFNIKINENLPSPFQDFRVIGISDDFKYQSLHEKVDPLVLCTDIVPLIRASSDVGFADFPDPKISLKLGADDIAATLRDIESVWKSITELPFSFTFLDDNINRQYQSEQKLGTILGIGTILAVLIACLGLFGMVTLLIAHKSKEIAIRKVLGASILDIVYYLNRKFTIMIAIACMIAVPLSLYIMHNWLQDFAYRIQPKWYIYAFAALIAMALAGLTISLQSIRAAVVNPIKSINAE